MNWQAAVEKTVSGLGYDLVDTERSARGLLRVFIDRLPNDPTGEFITVDDCERVTRQLQRARLHYGHGTERALDDAAALVWHALRLPRRPGAAALRRAVSAKQQAAVDVLVKRRVRERVPVVYLTHRCWFAGLELYIDPRVLIPRSPLAELIERGFAPWIKAGRVRRVLDLGTGSGCIAIACARAFPRARVDALDISADALAVARRNVRRHRLGGRVRTVRRQAGRRTAAPPPMCPCCRAR